MAMIKCPKCHRHISSMTSVCPECGCPINPELVQAEAEVEENEGGKPRKKKIGWWKYLLALVVLGVLIGGYLYCDYLQEQQREQHAYEMLQGCSNPDFYEDFIIRYPKSVHVDEVRERYKAAVARQQEWQRLVENGTREDLQRFVREHPASPYVKVAQGRIDSLDWVEAKERRTLESVARYVATHPDGYYVDHAEQLRQTLERQRAEELAAQRDSLDRADSLQAIAQPTT